MATRKHAYLQRLFGRYNNKDVVPTLEALKKLIVFHPNNIEILRHGCTLPNLANFCLHKSTPAKFHSFTEKGKEILEKKCEDIVGGSSIVFSRKAVVDKIFSRDWTNWCKTIFGVDSFQLYSFPKYQTMPNGLCTRWKQDSKSCKFKPRRNKTRSFENKVISYLQRTRPQSKVESFFTTVQRKTGCCLLWTLQQCV